MSQKPKREGKGKKAEAVLDEAVLDELGVNEVVVYEEATQDEASSSSHFINANQFVGLLEMLNATSANGLEGWKLTMEVQKAAIEAQKEVRKAAIEAQVKKAAMALEEKKMAIALEEKKLERQAAPVPPDLQVFRDGGVRLHNAICKTPQSSCGSSASWLFWSVSPWGRSRHTKLD